VPASAPAGEKPIRVMDTSAPSREATRVARARESSGLLRERSALVGVTVLGLVGTACQREETTSGSKSEASLTSARAFSAAQIRRQLQRHGLPLNEVTFNGSGPRAFTYERAGPVLQVDLYRTVAPAAGSEGLTFYVTPANYRVRGQVLNRVKGNVVVRFEGGRASVRRGVKAALADLN
jgi:hypothetical protein